ncbi:MAG TPA: hypothetical protein EYH30_08205 [Anaerolineales bacterium]|nr:hypothetical protein [Anaerolineales bacterium]
MLTVYHNEKRKAAFGEDGARAAAYTLSYRDGRVQTVSGGSLDTSRGMDVREGRVHRMDVSLA